MGYPGISCFIQVLDTRGFELTKVSWFIWGYFVDGISERARERESTKLVSFPRILLHGSVDSLLARIIKNQTCIKRVYKVYKRKELVWVFFFKRGQRTSIKLAFISGRHWNRSTSRR